MERLKPRRLWVLDGLAELRQHLSGKLNVMPLRKIAGGFGVRQMKTDYPIPAIRARIGPAGTPDGTRTR